MHNKAWVKRPTSQGMFQRHSQLDPFMEKIHYFSPFVRVLDYPGSGHVVKGAQNCSRICTVFESLGR